MIMNTDRWISKFKKDEISEFLEKITFTINAYGIWRSSENRQISYTNSDFEIVYYSKGGSKTTILDKVYDCKEQSMLILTPYGLYTSINAGYLEYEYYYLHFDIQPRSMQKEFIRLLTSNGHVIDKSEYGDLGLMFVKLLKEIQQQEIGYLSVIESGLLRIIVEIIRAQNKRKAITMVETNTSNKAMEDINRAIIYIQENLEQPLFVNDVAKAMLVSESYLYKLFKEVLHTSPSQYIMKLKMIRAKEYLLKNYSVEEVASKLGFSSAYHFSNTFKDKMQISPKKYQMKYREY